MGRVPAYIADPSVTPELLYVPALRNLGFRDDPSTDEYRSHDKLNDHFLNGLEPKLQRRVFRYCRSHTTIPSTSNTGSSAIALANRPSSTY
ncbi:hypothetical protein SNK03_006999 [Fusarium graminearum]|uniref:Chromosome 2, complete genome n=2 Tax=Gibberella zeae TaxID=5518 RepID=A0A098DJL2_GIBZE|nr:unnamed protein product [Fusarium graminearum]CAF3648539.1 unnamed protein product [Fusarium graminearum]CAF3653220.1 unnamed protein product [Fusarium graminearum]CAG1980821.1 unnamed protein product [Fusarium graminearum]CAG1995265.1 unnamed protein product [Fusarium graminearum]